MDGLHLCLSYRIDHFLTILRQRRVQTYLHLCDCRIDRLGSLFPISTAQQRRRSPTSMGRLLGAHANAGGGRRQKCVRHAEAKAYFVICVGGDSRTRIRSPSSRNKREGERKGEKGDCSGTVERFKRRRISVLGFRPFDVVRFSPFGGKHSDLHSLTRLLRLVLQPRCDEPPVASACKTFRGSIDYTFRARHVPVLSPFPTLFYTNSSIKSRAHCLSLRA